MAGFDENAGMNRLAVVMSRRMKQECERPLVLDFGEIQANGSLVTNTFPVPIPKGDYSMCGQMMQKEIRSGDRLLVAWVQNEAVVIDIIMKLS